MVSLLNNPKIKGFTLIELLVVVAIIGILASVVLASLNSARDKGRISAIKSSVLEFRKIMELEYNENGSYLNLNKGWAGTAPSPSCDTIGYAGNYATKAVEICKQVRSLMTPNQNDFFTGVNTALGLSNSNSYSIIAHLPTGYYFCAGSGGRTSELGTGVDNWIAPGCWSNP